MQWEHGRGLVPIIEAGASAPIPAVVPARSIIDDEDDDDELSPQPVVAPSVRPAPAPPRAVKASQRPLAPKDVVRMARERLREIDRDIKRLRKLESERAELRRLLDAATNKPRAVVRELPKRSAG